MCNFPSDAVVICKITSNENYQISVDDYYLHYYHWSPDVNSACKDAIEVTCTMANLHIKNAISIRIITLYLKIIFMFHGIMGWM